MTMEGSCLITEDISFTFVGGFCLGMASSGFEVKVISRGPEDLLHSFLLIKDINSFITLAGTGLEKDKQTVDWSRF